MSWLKRPNIFKKKDATEQDKDKTKNDPVEPSADENFNSDSTAPTGSPPPAARSETAGSVRSRIQPTLMEDQETIDHHADQDDIIAPDDQDHETHEEDGMNEEAGSGGEDDGNDSESENESETDDDDDDDDVAAPPLDGMYDPAEFENLNVSPEIKELFSFIMRYTPQTIDLETRFKPFIPEYIPAVGDIDAFIKVKRPDGKTESLGLSVLDEPAAKQSDPSVLELQLRAISKQSSSKAAQVKKVESGEKASKEIDKWIKDISDLHRSKPPPTVHYSKPMPDIDQLMQEWPHEVEEILKETGIPTAEFDCDLASFVDVCCAVLDIPVYKSRIQSLHVLFSLYSAFRNSQHFNQLANENNINGGLKVDRMEL